MTDAERPPNADSDHREDETAEAAKTGPDVVSEVQDPSRAASFRSDGGPGSVLRERQPGFGGMDAREAAEGEPHWQAVTSDRYGHRIDPGADRSDEPEVKSPGEETDGPSGGSPGR